jgi:hypothetical protein
VLRAERAFAEQVGKGLTLAPGARAFVEHAHGRARLAVVTRASRREVEFVLQLAGLASAFECVVSADDAPAPPPSPARHEAALARLARRRPAPRALALEDSLPACARRGRPARAAWRWAPSPRTRRRRPTPTWRRSTVTRSTPSPDSSPAARNACPMSSLDLSSGAEPVAVTDVAGHPVTLHFGDAEAEYNALQTGAALVDRSQRGRIRVSGPRAAEMVTGLVTNDVIALAPGHGAYAAVLTPKGKIVADVRVVACGAGGGDGADGQPAGAVESLLIDSPARASAGLLDVVRKYINPRVAPYRDEHAATRLLGVYGPNARLVVAETLGLSGSRSGSSRRTATSPARSTARR